MSNCDIIAIQKHLILIIIDPKHDVSKLQKKSHFTITAVRAKRATITFWTKVN